MISPLSDPSTMLPRLSWKTAFYDFLLPRLRRLPPDRADAVLQSVARATHALWPPANAVLERASRRAREVFPALDPARFRARLAAHRARFLARDLMLDGRSDGEVRQRFEVSGDEHLHEALARGRGAIVLGSHFGAHVAAIHWLYRDEVPLRLLVQRPRHVSGYLQQQFDRDLGPHPQAGLFLKRSMPASEASARLVLARRALRDGLAVYLSGDIPWPSASSRPGRLLGLTQPFLTLWADLAALTGAQVVPVFCRFLAGGRFSLVFDPPFEVEPGGEAQCVSRYLARLETLIALDPSQAVAQLTWPCYLEAAEPRSPARPHPRIGSAVSESIR